MLTTDWDPESRAENAGYALGVYLENASKGKMDAAARGEVALKAYLEVHESDTQYDDIRDLVGDLLHYVHEHGDVEDMDEFVREPARRFNDGIRTMVSYDGETDDHQAKSRMEVTNLLSDLAVLASAEEMFTSADRFFFGPLCNFETEDDMDEDDELDEEFDEEFDEDDDDEFRM